MERDQDIKTGEQSCLRKPLLPTCRFHGNLQIQTREGDELANPRSGAWPEDSHVDKIEVEKQEKLTMSPEMASKLSERHGLSS